MSGTPGLNPRSGMISLDLPAGTVRPVPGGVDDHHVTVVYLGPDVDDAAFAKACARARDVAAKADGPLTGSVGGVDSFPPSDSSDGKRPAYAPVRLPGAKRIRSGLEDLSASEHKNWVPHVTLAYVGKDDPLPPPVPPTPVKFTHLSVHRGGDVKRFPLGGGSAHSGSGPAVDLSAQTARLAETPSPWGSPSGPGLWRHKSWKLPNYVEQVSKGIMKSGRAATESQAIQMALGVLARWARGGGKVSPEVQAAAAKAIADYAALKAAAAAHSHSNEDGGAMTLTWNGQSVDLASIDLGGYLPPHVPAGSPTGGQFGTTSGGSSPAPASAKGKAAAQAKAAATARKAALHAQAKKLRVQAAAITAQIAGINATIALQVKASAAAKAKPKASAAAKAAAAVKKAATTSAAATKAKTAAKKAKKPTLAQNRSTVATLHSKAHALWSQAAKLDAQANAIKLSSDKDSSPFLDLAFAEALADRVPPGRPEGGQFTPGVVQLTRHDTPAMAARAVNAMDAGQRAMIRATILVPPGFAWATGDRLAAAELACPAVQVNHTIPSSRGRSPGCVV